MIYVIMHGRLGNQFFQYAFAKKMQSLRTNDEIAIYFGRVQKRNNEWTNDLIHFQTGKYKIEKNLYNIFRAMSFMQKCALIFYLIRCRFVSNQRKMDYQIQSQTWLNKIGLYWLKNGEFVPVNSTQKNIFICGHFEHYSFYTGMENQLRTFFSPKQPLCNWNVDLYKTICETESVCISIRRGDYLTSANKSTYFLCDKEYFEKAISKMKELVPNATFIFFSDDTDWIRENFKGENVYYESHNNPIWEKVRLMSACKHFIISNSTFSWWNQYLSQNKGKIVVSPNRWKNGSSYKGLVSPNFTTIEV